MRPIGLTQVRSVATHVTTTPLHRQRRLRFLLRPCPRPLEGLDQKPARCNAHFLGGYLSQADNPFKTFSDGSDFCNASEGVNESAGRRNRLPHPPIFPGVHRFFHTFSVSGRCWKPCGISFSLSGPFSDTARDKLKLIPPGSPRLRHY